MLPPSLLYWFIGYRYIKGLAFLTEHDDMTDEDINISSSRLVEAYLNDLSDDFPREFRQFIFWYKEQKSANTKGKGSGRFMFQLLHSTGVYHAFPNTEVALRIYLCLMTTNCSGERSFSQTRTY